MSPFWALVLLLLSQICYYTVPDCISQHSPEFTSPAIDLWHEAQERRHERLWQGFESRVFHWSNPGFSATSDMLTDASTHELRLNPGLVKLWKRFVSGGRDCGYIYGADYGCPETETCWITSISIKNCGLRHRCMKYPTFNPGWSAPSMSHISSISGNKGQRCSGQPWCDVMFRLQKRRLWNAPIWNSSFWTDLLVLMTFICFKHVVYV